MNLQLGQKAAMRCWLPSALILFAASPSLAALAPPRTFPAPSQMEEPTARRLPRWRGFNLLYKFNAAASPTPAAVMAEDFRLISALGFNFVRVPMDYRAWITNGDWAQIDESKLADVDRIVALGAQHRVHVCLNLHRAPGYTVAKPAEPRDLWQDVEAQRVCAKHWATLARRYRGIPNARITFNLFNEPAGVSEAGYFAVVKKMLDAIHAEDPGRLVLCDGLDYGNLPPRTLQSLGVALCTRGYRPMNISHFRASWITGAEGWKTPCWPAPQVSAFFYGDGKPELQSPLRLEGPLGGTTLRLQVNTVSSRARLRATTGDGRTIWEHLFVPGPGAGEWKTVVPRPEWKTYQNVYDREYSFPIPPGIQRLDLQNIEGDWLTVSAISIDAAGHRATIPTMDTWGLRQAGALRYDPNRGAEALQAASNLDRAWLREECYGAWREASRAGLGVMIGEMGAYRFSPHTVVLRWMEDVLAIAQEAGWGWALWEFRGTFGVLDSQRTDVAYESWEGHQLDRQLLELLQKY